MPRTKKLAFRGQLLKEYRERHNVSHLDLYDQIHVPPDTLKNMEYGRAHDVRVTNFLPVYEMLVKDKQSGVKSPWDCVEEAEFGVEPELAA